MDKQQRDHCRMDLHKVQRGEWSAAEFIAQWGEYLNADLERE